MIGTNNKEDIYSRKDCLDEFAVRRLFVFLKENLNFDYLQDTFIQENLISKRELAEDILTVHKYLRSEQFLKLIIKRKRCQEFVACMQEFPELEHINERIREFKNTHSSIQLKKMSEESLNKQFVILYTKLEPRDIADKMFQAGQISAHDHDDITNNRKKYKRLKILLDVLNRNQLYASFEYLLKSLQLTQLLEALNADTPYIFILSKDALCIQHNFTTLQDELPGADAATNMMESVLSESNVSDIESCNGTYRQKSKLLKILILNEQYACKKLFEAIRTSLKREDLIQKMRNHSEGIIRRGKPVLESSLRCLTTACLRIHEDFLYDELEPRDLCDFLFEEEAVDILSHDKITETNRRRKQVKFLLETLMENKNDCFHFFLYILQRKHYDYIRQTLEQNTPSSSVEVDGVRNEPIQLRLAVQYSTGTEMHKILYQHINSFDTSLLRDMISRGQITIEHATSISVEVQLRHTSDKPVPEREDDKFKKVLRNVYKMLEKAETYLTQVMNSANQLQIRIHVQNSCLESPKSSDNIRKKMSSNYQKILDEMQLSLARETLSRCTGNVAELWKKIAPESGSRTQRMCDVLHFIFQHKGNRVEFEKILKENGLKNVTDTWTEAIDLGNLRVLLESFNIVVPNYSRESIDKTLLDESLLNECVHEVRSLARRVVLCKNFDEKNKKQNPGTVMVYEVIVMNEDNEVFIYEKDPEYWSAFFEKKQKENLVKVILIEGIWQNVSTTKEKVYQKYQKYIDSGKFHLHHESEQYSEIAKISALQSIKLCQQYVESVRASIPLDNIDDIVRKSTDRTLTEERIKEMCCNTNIDGVGTANDDPYFVRFFLTLNRIKGEIKQKTIESMKERLQSELFVEITRHINLELQSKFELATVSLAIHQISGMLLVLIASLLNPIAGAAVAVVTGLVSLVIGQDVNSRRWREKIAMEISDEISKQRVQISKKLSSHLWTIFHETSDNLKNVSEYLEDYKRRIAYTD